MKAKLVAIALASSVFAAPSPARASDGGGADAGARDSSSEAGTSDGSSAPESGIFDASPDTLSALCSDGYDAAVCDSGGHTPPDAGEVGSAADGGAGSKGGGGCSVGLTTDDSTVGGLVFLAGAIGAVGGGFARRGLSAQGSRRGRRGSREP